MNRAELHLLAQERILDAEALLNAGRWSFAYYVAGYAVEFALKSCFLNRMIHTGWVFQEKAKVDDCLIHDFEKLIRLSGLKDQLNANCAANQAFAGYWGVTSQWTVSERYEQNSQAKAKALYAAINDPSDGVLQWIMNYW